MNILSLDVVNAKLAKIGDTLVDLLNKSEDAQIHEEIVVRYTKLQDNLGELYKCYYDMEFTNCSVKKKQELQRIFDRAVLSFFADVAEFEILIIKEDIL